MRARLVLVPIALAAALLTGCVSKSDTTAPSPSASSVAPADNGVAALSADEILSKSVTALTTAGSFRVKGSTTVEGDKATIDMQLSGKNAKATLTMTGMTIDIIKIDTDLYVKLPDSMLTSNPALANLPAGQKSAVELLLKGKYIKTSVTDADFKDFAASLDPNGVLKPESGSYTKGSAGTTNGVPSIALVDGKGNKLYIATTGQPYPLQLEANTGETAQFTEIGTATEIKAPTANQVFDLKSVMGK